MTQASTLNPRRFEPRDLARGWWMPLLDEAGSHDRSCVPDGVPVPVTRGVVVAAAGHLAVRVARRGLAPGR